MHALRLRGSLHRAVCVSTRAYAAALPGYPTPGTAFSPPPAPTRATEDTQPPTSARTTPGSSALPSSLGAAKTSSTLPKTDIPIFTSLADLRSWRDKAFRDGKTVGFVPTMGALHDGHITLVRESLKENDLTVVSIYVNPAQFAPHEDLATYPRTLDSDVSLLSKLHSTDSPSRPPVAVFLPPTSEMYPSGLSHSTQLGTYVLPPPSLASQMEGKSRPTFFRGVATVVTKLLNAVLPTRVYFGQKDIQQALLMRGMVRDLCMGVRVRVVKTVREEVVTSEEGAGQVEGLALSSRNAYLSAQERAVAPTLRRALGAVQAAWYAGASRSDALAAGRAVVDEVAARAEGVTMRLDYIEMNDPVTLEVVPEELRAGGEKGPAVILSGALWVGRTRLIDNVLLGDAGWVFE